MNELISKNQPGGASARIRRWAEMMMLADKAARKANQEGDGRLSQ